MNFDFFDINFDYIQEKHLGNEEYFKTKIGFKDENGLTFFRNEKKFNN